MLITAPGAVQELVNQHDVTGLVFFLQRTDGADADDPGHTELLHRPNIGAMVQLARQDAMAAPVSCQKNDIAPGQFARQQIIGGWSERRPDPDPFLAGESLEVVKSGAADDADAMFRHNGFLTVKYWKYTKKEWDCSDRARRSSYIVAKICAAWNRPPNPQSHMNFPAGVR